MLFYESQWMLNADGIFFIKWNRETIGMLNCDSTFIFIYYIYIYAVFHSFLCSFCFEWIFKM